MWPANFYNWWTRWLLDDCEKWLAEQPSREFQWFDWAPMTQSSILRSQRECRNQTWVEKMVKGMKWSILMESIKTPPKWVVAEQRIPTITIRFDLPKECTFQKNLNFCVHIFAKSQPKHLKLYNIAASKTEDETDLSNQSPYVPQLYHLENTQKFHENSDTLQIKKVF